MYDIGYLRLNIIYFPFCVMVGMGLALTIGKVKTRASPGWNEGDDPAITEQISRFCVLKYLLRAWCIIMKGVHYEI